MATRIHESSTGAGRAVFQRQGEYWRIVYEGETSHLRDIQGLRQLAVLLGHPGTPVAAGMLAEARRLTTQGEEHIELADGEIDAKRAERDRLNVTRAVKVAIDKVAGHLPALGAHLRATIRTGGQCLYNPDPRASVAWECEASPSKKLTETSDVRADDATKRRGVHAKIEPRRGQCLP